jgi:hypothetical protein
MARCPEFRRFGEDVLRRNVGEIGMHLHAWDTPPLQPLTCDDLTHQPYLMEYPPELMREKMVVMTNLLEDTFGRKMVSHRAGRWGFNATYARMLAELGYRVDCSVTPHKSWRTQKGAPDGSGGPDFSRFPDTAYFLNLDDISRPGDSPLLEVPLTVMRPWQSLGRTLHRLTAWGPRLCRAVVKSDIEQLYSDLNELFATARKKGFRGATLEEYADEFSAAGSRVPQEAGQP